MANVGRGWSPARQAFMSGKTAMLISSTSDVAMMEKNAAEKGFELGTAFLPRPADSEKGGVIIGGGSLWLLKDHPKKELDAAWDFIKWMAEPAQQIKWHKNTGYFPVTNSAIEELMYNGYFSEHPNYLTALNQLLLAEQNRANQGALIGSFPELRDLVETAVEKTLNEELTPQQALNEAAEKANEILQEYNSFFK